MSIKRVASVTLLYPPFKLMLESALEEAHKQGLMAYPFETYRFPERQTHLYAQGRTAPGKIITNAKAGFSWHQYGVAVDLVFDKDPSTRAIEWTWEGGYADEHGDNYDKLAKIVKSYGLEWLGDLNIERAHFEKKFGFSIQQAKQIADTKGVLGLWHEFDKKLEGVA
jgi:peptidoglycan LD-endopeptidase CwlK